MMVVESATTPTHTPNGAHTPVNESSTPTQAHGSESGLRHSQCKILRYFHNSFPVGKGMIDISYRIT